VVLCGYIMPNMWSETKMNEAARQARLLAFFSSLSNKDKGLVLKVLGVIHKENQGNSGDSLENDLCIEISNTDNPLDRTRE